MYRQRDVERLLGLPQSTIRALVEAGFVAPARGPRNARLYSFQDLIVLRTAQALAAAGVPRHRIARAMKELRRREQSGQYALPFDAGAGKGSLSAIARPKVPPPDAAEWFARAVALEGHDAEGAIRAYQRSIDADPALLDARINLGLMLHQAGQLAKAERVYREAIEACGEDPLLSYNLGVLLEDLGRRADALRAYLAALRADSRLADGHYNVALLYKALGKPRDAIRHMAAYRRLSRPK